MSPSSSNHTWLPPLPRSDNETLDQSCKIHHGAPDPSFHSNLILVLDSRVGFRFEYIDPRLLAVSPGEERPRPGCSDLLGDSDYPNDMLTEDVVLRPVMEVAKQIHRKIEAAQRLDPSRADMPLDHQLDKY